MFDEFKKCSDIKCYYLEWIVLLIIIVIVFILILFCFFKLNGTFNKMCIPMIVCMIFHI